MTKPEVVFQSNVELALSFQMQTLKASTRARLISVERVRSDATRAFRLDPNPTFARPMGSSMVALASQTNVHREERLPILIDTQAVHVRALLVSCAITDVTILTQVLGS
jgi:hypothetical protein